MNGTWYGVRGERKIRMKYLRWLPALAYAGLIFYLSSRAWPAPTELPAGTDKVIHLCIYAVLGFVLLWALRTTRLKDHPFLVVIAGCMGFAYGVFDEIHQAFVPGRTPSVWDAIADGTPDTTPAASACGGYPGTPAAIRSR